MKVDYLLKEAKMEDKTEVIKDLPNIEEVDKFFKEDIVKLQSNSPLIGLGVF
ncbi:hypothetical protein [Prevotella intermedia]|uniref:hypothetical protein n=1 Tax=Prevotella intermedia TaxID=28131 RepID=UPI001FCACC21|nr:hypothetical protein [Prevotella intermedia]